MKISNFYTQEELLNLGFKSIGKNVKISRLANIYGTENIEIGNNVRIEDFCILNGDIVIGNNVKISAYSLLDGNAGITIKDYVSFAARVSVHSGSDDYSGEYCFGCFAPMHLRHRKAERVIFESFCLVGDGSTILPGVTLSEGTSVGAMSLIKETTEPWYIYAGIPARKIKEKSKNIIKLYNNGNFDF